MNISLVATNYDAGKYRKGENLGIKAIEAVLRLHGHMVYIHDLNFIDITVEELVRLIINNGSKIVGFSVSFTHQIYETIRVAQKMRDKLSDVHFTIGGQGISFIIKEVLENNTIFDSGICFEGELTFLDLIQYLEENKDIGDIKGLYYRSNGEVGFNGYRNPVNDLDQFPFMHREILSQGVIPAHISMITSRGCVGKCLFCSSGYFSNRYHKSKKWRYRTANNIIEEIEMIKGKNEKLAISFIDDNFLGGTQEGYERAKRFSEIILNRKLTIKWAIECRVDDISYELFELMRKAGLMNVFLGVESGNQRDLKLFNKNITLSQIDNAINILEDLGLTYDIGFIMFHPTSTIEQLITNALFLKKYVCANSKSLLNELSLYHGSPLVKYYEVRGLVIFKEYSILCSYENQDVEKILYVAKELLNTFLKDETQLDSILFRMQNKYAELRQWGGFRKYLKMKKRLSDFEADIFIELCRNIENLNYIDMVLKKKVDRFKLDINQLQEV